MLPVSNPHPIVHTPAVLLMGLSLWGVAAGTRAIAQNETNAVPGDSRRQSAQQAEKTKPQPVDIAVIRRRENVPFPPIAGDQIRSYTIQRVNSPPAIDGRLSDTCWTKATQSTRFVDLITGEPTIHDTRIALLWDETYLYIGYWIEDPFVQAKFLTRDSPIYNDNDVEFFLAFDNAYYEFEINAHGTIYEGLFVWQDAYRTLGLNRIPEINIESTNVRSQQFNGVGFKTHPRGLRYAFLDWDFPGLQSAVSIDGTLNDDADRDRGWQVELAVPWAGMRTIASGDERPIPPLPNDVWRMDFSRFNQFGEAPPALDSRGWALSPHGVWDSHIPEAFAKIRFVEQSVD